MGFKVGFLVVGMTTSISRCCKWHFFLCLSMWNNWIAASCPWPVSCGPVKGTSLINHHRFKKWATGDQKRRFGKGELKCPACGMPHQCLTQGFCTLQPTVIYSGAILSAFFSFISKLLKTTLWIGRWSMSFLLHAISHHPCPPPPAYMHTSFNSNRKSKWREKGKAPSLSIFPVFPLK